MATAAKKSKKTTEVAIAVITLATIVAAGMEGMFVSPAVFEPLELEGLVEVNREVTNEAGEVATRATQKGVDTVRCEQLGIENPVTYPDEKAAPVVKSSFAIEDGIPMPVSTGRGRGNHYPFDALQVGQSFFVENTEAMPNASKSLASTVSSAKARYAVADPERMKTNRKGEAVPVMNETRKFVVRAVEGGARVWRTA